MSTRSYGQYCPLAQTMDAVGDRWALLVVRELLWGPQRFTDLQAALPGIGTNQLSTRLRELEAEGLVGKRLLPPPAASTVYELTPEGARLEPALLALVRFGLPRLHALTPVNTFRPGWAALALRALAGTGRVATSASALASISPSGHAWLCEIRVEDVVFHTRIDWDTTVTSPGPAPDTAGAAVIRTDTITAFALARAQLTIAEAREQGLLHAADDDAVVAWARDSGLLLSHPANDTA